MGIDESHEDRLMAHAVPGDDPTWGEVSAFMEAVDSAYAEVPTTQYEAAHMAVVAGAARSIRNGLHTSRRKTMKDLFTFKSHRMLIATVVAGLLALTAGVGAASALGGGPLANLFPAAPTETSTQPTTVPTATPTEIDDEADDQGDDQGDDSDDPTPKARPTSTHDDQDSEEATDHSRSDDGDDQGDKAEKTHDDGDDDQGEDSDDQGDDDHQAGSQHGDNGDDSGDDGGHEDDSDD